jgi:hypothetical protein
MEAVLSGLKEAALAGSGTVTTSLSLCLSLCVTTGEEITDEITEDAAGGFIAA